MKELLRSRWAQINGPHQDGLLCAVLSIAVLHSLAFAHPRSIVSFDPETYRPVGLLKITHPGPPPDLSFKILWLIALVCALLILWPKARRIAFFPMSVAGLFVVSAYFSFQPMWSHGQVATYLIVLLLFPHFASRTGSAWSVKAAQLGLALFFFNAFYWKMHNVGLEWALSDNLRWILFARYYVHPVEAPPLVDFIAAHRWAFRGAAVANLVCQASPLLLFFLFRFRWARRLGFAVAALEGFAISYVMQLWEMWALIVLPLIFLLPPKPLGKPNGAAAVWLSLVLSYFTLTAWTRLEKEQRNFPFSAVPMYAALYGPNVWKSIYRANPPLPETLHQASIREFGTPLGPKMTDEGKRRLERLRVMARHQGIELESAAVDLILFEVPEPPSLLPRALGRAPITQKDWTR